LLLKVQLLPAQDLPVLHFNPITEKDGLPSTKSISHLLRDKRGFVWTSGASGLYRYDGFRFKKLQVKGPVSQQQQFDKYCYNTVATGDSVFWTSSHEGLMRVNYYTGEYWQYPAHKIFHNQFIHESLVSLNDQQALIAVKDSTWILNAKGIEKAIPFQKDNGLGNIWRMYADNKGRIWADAYLDPHLARWNKTFTGFDTIIAAVDARAMLFTDNNSKLWMPTWGAGMQVMNMSTGSITVLPEFRNKIFSRSALYRHRGNKAYIITGLDIGLLLTDPQTLKSRFIEVPDKNGLKEARVVLNEPDGSVWILCNAGLLYLSSQQEPVRNYYFDKMMTLPRNFYDDAIYTGYFLSEWKDRFWISLYYAGGAVEINRNEEFIQHYPYIGKSTDHNSRAINTVIMDREGRNWVVTDNSISLCNEKMQAVKTIYVPAAPPGHQDVHLKQPYLLNDSIILVRGGRSLHLFNYRKQAFTLHRTQPVNLPAGYNGMAGSLRSVWVQQNDLSKVWYLQDNGVFRYNFFTGINDVRIDTLGFCGRFAADRQGNIWIASLQGMLKLNTNSLEVEGFSKLPGAQYRQATSICIDSSGRVWVSSQEGLQGFDPATREFVKLTIANAVISNSPMDVMACTSDGRVYYGYQNGFAFFDPDNFFAQKQRAIINDIALNDSSFLWRLDKNGDKAITLPYGRGQLAISFASAVYHPWNNTGYYYRFAGKDSAWHELDKGVLSLVNPASGIYQVEVANSAYPAVGETDRIIITILPPFYKSLWFLLLTGLLIAGIIFYFVYNRVRSMRLKNDLEKTRLENETLQAQYRQKIADTELALLHSQMNPHFTFNCLNSIKLYIEQNDIEAASGYLTKFSKLIRIILDNSRSERVTLASELSSLRLYLELEAMRFKNKLDYSLVIEENLDEEFIELPPLLIQPYVENAIWHGLMHKEAGGKLQVAISRVDDFLIITVEDNGIGRKMAAALKSKSVLKNKSHGTVITHERIALINKHFKQDASVVIKDLVDSKGTPTGTLVTIKIPV